MNREKMEKKSGSINLSRDILTRKRPEVRSQNPVPDRLLTSDFCIPSLLDFPALSWSPKSGYCYHFRLFLHIKSHRI